MLQLQVDRAAVSVTVRLIVVAAVTVELRESQQTNSGCAPFIFATDIDTTAAHDNAATIIDVRHDGGITATAGGIHHNGTRVDRWGTVLQAVDGRRVGFGFHVHFELDGAVGGCAGREPEIKIRVAPAGRLVFSGTVVVHAGGWR